MTLAMFKHLNLYFWPKVLQNAILTPSNMNLLSRLQILTQKPRLVFWEPHEIGIASLNEFEVSCLAAMLRTMRA